MLTLRLSTGALQLALPRRPRAEHYAPFPLCCAKLRAIATVCVRVWPSCPQCPYKHTSMPHLRTWLAFSFASGQSRGVPMALQHAPSTSDPQFWPALRLQAIVGLGVQQTHERDSDYSIRAFEGLMSRSLQLYSHDVICSRSLSLISPNSLFSLHRRSRIRPASFVGGGLAAQLSRVGGRI
jgi:hypothetical protein